MWSIQNDFKKTEKCGKQQQQKMTPQLIPSNCHPPVAIKSKTLALGCVLAPY